MWGRHARHVHASHSLDLDGHWSAVSGQPFHHRRIDGATLEPSAFCDFAEHPLFHDVSDQDPATAGSTVFEEDLDSRSRLEYLLPAQRRMGLYCFGHGE